jgi:hypothetical protein
LSFRSQQHNFTPATARKKSKQLNPSKNTTI